MSVVYIILGNTVAKFSKSRVWNKVPDRYNLISGDALMFLIYSVGCVEENLYAKTRLQPI